MESRHSLVGVIRLRNLVVKVNATEQTKKNFLREQ
jgi:hypothetical protein